jgi:hypothetical protein
MSMTLIDRARALLLCSSPAVAALGVVTLAEAPEAAAQDLDVISSFLYVGPDDSGGCSGSGCGSGGVVTSGGGFFGESASGGAVEYTGYFETSSGSSGGEVHEFTTLIGSQAIDRPNARLRVTYDISGTAELPATTVLRLESIDVRHFELPDPLGQTFFVFNQDLAGVQLTGEVESDGFDFDGQEGLWRVIIGVYGEVFGPSSGFEIFVNSVRVELVTGGCNTADVSPPYGLLDLSDIAGFISAFLANGSVGDPNGDGLFDLNDLVFFVGDFTGGCS